MQSCENKKGAQKGSQTSREVYHNSAKKSIDYFLLRIFINGTKSSKNTL